MARPLIHDCDPGLDDAAALLMALGNSARLEVKAVTAVAGNVPLAATYRNARGLLALAGREDVPCYAGCDRALLVPPITAEQVHGADGIGGVALPEPTTLEASTHAVDAIVDLCRGAAASGEKLTLVITGPMSNIAAALIIAPDLLEGVQEIVFMGGVVLGEGNITPYAEFNFAVDPHAAALVLDRASGKVPIVMMGLDVTRQVEMTDSRIQDIREIGTEVASRLADMLREYRDSADGGDRVLHDPCTMAYLLEPGLFEYERASISIDTSGGDQLGRSNAEWLANGAVRVAVKIDDNAFYRLLTECIRSL